MLKSKNNNRLFTIPTIGIDSEDRLKHSILKMLYRIQNKVLESTGYLEKWLHNSQDI